MIFCEGWIPSVPKHQNQIENGRDLLNFSVYILVQKLHAWPYLIVQDTDHTGY